MQKPYSGEYVYVTQQGITNFTKHELHMSWRMMNVRCLDSRHKAYHRYGGRGIGVCPSWRWDNPSALSNFIKAVGDRPTGMTLDRVDNEGGYHDGNWKWSTRKQQSNNLSVGLRNKSGVIGVSWDEGRFCWVSQIGLMGSTVQIGRYNVEDRGLAQSEYERVKQVKVLEGDNSALKCLRGGSNMSPVGIRNERNKTSKYYGVSWHKKSEKWRAYLMEDSEHGKRQKSLGLYDCEEAAHKAVLCRLKLTGRLS